MICLSEFTFTAPETTVPEVSVTVIPKLNEEDNPQPDGTSLTIDELAQRVGMTVRNLREWRTLGLLPRAEIRGRVGYYDPAVVARIEGIQRLHAEGFPLELIRRMLDMSGDLGDEVMRFAGALRAPFREQDAPVVDLAEWESRWGASGPDDLHRALELGLIRERADGRLEFASARVARVGEALHALGLSLQEILDATAEIRANADRIADLFEQVWLRHVWQPFIDAGMPEDSLPRLQETLAQVQPLAMDAVVALFTVAMEAKIEEGIAREVARAAEGKRKRPRRRA
jgi:DNA-binding transcriptional MerR regulator